MSTRDNSFRRRIQRMGQLVYAREMAERQASNRPLSANPQMVPAYNGGFAAFKSASQPSFDKIPGSGQAAVITSESAAFNVPVISDPVLPRPPPAVRVTGAGPPVIPPLAPRITRIDGGAEELIIYFEPGRALQNAKIDRYEISLNGGATYGLYVGNVVLSPVGVRNSQNGAILVNGTEYSVRMRLISGEFTGEPSNLVKATPDIAPEAPTINSAEPTYTSGGISFGFSAPSSNGGSDVRRYEYSLNGGSWVDIGIPSGLVHTISGLKNGDSYTLRLRAVNTKEGAITTWSEAIIPDVKPAAPTITDIVGDDKKLQVYFTLGQNQGSSIKEYTYKLIKTTDSTIISGDIVFVPIPISGQPNTFKLDIINSAGAVQLINGITYKVSIKVKNTLYSDYSNPEFGMPDIAPLAPTKLYVIGSDGTLTIAFSRPIVPDGGTPITDYYYNINSDGIDRRFGPNTIEGGLSLTITGLINGINQTISIYASNGADGTPLTVSGTPEKAPDAPLISMTGDNQQLIVTLDNDGSNSGSAIVDYYFKINAGGIGHTDWIKAGPRQTSPQGKKYFIITSILRRDNNNNEYNDPIVNNTEYNVIVKAYNTTEGPDSNEVTATPNIKPAPPVIKYLIEADTTADPVTGLYTGNELAFVFTHDTSNGAAVTKYEYLVRALSGETANTAQWTAFTPEDAPSLGAGFKKGIVTNLIDGVKYSLKLRVGNTVYSDESAQNPEGAPDVAPPVVSFTAAGYIGIDRKAKIDITFSSPETNYGSAIQLYQYRITNSITWNGDSPNPNWANNPTWYDAGTSPHPITKYDNTTDLVAGTVYAIQMRAKNTLFGPTGPNSTTTPDINPAAPDFTLTGGNNQITVSFTDADTNGGSAIKSYAYSVDGGIFIPLTAPEVSAKSFTIISNINNGTIYNIRLKAINNTNKETVTPATKSVTPDIKPLAPTGVTLTEGNKQLTVTLNKPAANGGSSIQKYEYSLNGGSSFIDTGITGLALTAATVTFTITGLINGESYSVVLRAKNTLGGDASTPVSKKPDLAPNVPIINGAAALVAVNGFTVGYIAPAVNDGSAITKYQYSYSSDDITWTSFADATLLTGTLSTTGSFNITGLTAGNSYRLKLRAVNTIDGAVAVFPAEGQPRRVLDIEPSAPALISIALSGQTITITIGGATANGTPIQKYEYAISTNDIYGAWTDVTNMTFALIGEAGKTYKAKARAKNYLYGPALETANSVVVDVMPTAPTNLSVSSVGDKSVTIAFSPAISAGTPITKYSYSTDAGANWVDINSTSSPITITKQTTSGTPNLVNGTKYTILLRAHNATFASLEPHASIDATSIEPPGQPSIISITPGHQQLKIDFTQGTGGTVTNYAYSTDGGASWKDMNPINITSPVVITTLSNSTTQLQNGTSYQISIKAKNIVYGLPSTPVVDATPNDIAPGKVNIYHVARYGAFSTSAGWNPGSGDNYGEVVWDSAIVPEGGSDIIAYEYIIDSAGSSGTNGQWLTGTRYDFEQAPTYIQPYHTKTPKGKWYILIRANSGSLSPKIQVRAINRSLLRGPPSDIANMPAWAESSVDYTFGTITRV